MNSPISLGCEDIETVVGSVIRKDGGADKNIGKAMYAFRALQPVWI